MTMTTQPGSPHTATEHPLEILQAWARDFDTALAARDRTRLIGMFETDGYLRDLLALTWSIRSLHGSDQIAATLLDAAQHTNPANIDLDRPDAATSVDRPGWGTTVEGFLRFDLIGARGRGYVKLREQGDGTWRVWTMLMAVDALIGYEELIGARRPQGIDAGGFDGTTWLERRERAREYEDHDPAVLIIGAGHSALTLAARLSVLGVDTLMVERNVRVGDNWRNRYRSLYLHNQVWANHLPYVEYPPTWPIYTSKDKLADWLESYVATLDLNVWLATNLTGASYDTELGIWTASLLRGDGTERTLRPRHVVFATGVFGEPRHLDLPGSEEFAGDIVRSQDYTFDADASGKKVLVIGTGSSAHDIAQDYCVGGAEVTMLQRSTTCVVSVEPGSTVVYAPYREGGAPAEDTDFIGASTPLLLLAELHKGLTKQIAELDADLLSGLEAAGFRLDFGENGSGFMMKYYRNGGGYYLNVGCSDLIIAGKIKIKNGVEVDHLTATHAVFTDGTSLEVDTVAVATGFTNMQTTVAKVLGAEVAERVGPVWGLDDEGEVRAMWRPLAQPHLWIMGGSFVQCRLMSKILALQIKAREVNLVADLPDGTVTLAGHGGPGRHSD